MKLTAKDINKFSNEELQSNLVACYEDLLINKGKLSFDASGSNGNQVKTTRKSIARLLTKINTNSRNEIRATSKVLPKHMRPKLTRKLRRSLSASHANKLTAKATRKSFGLKVAAFTI